MLFLLLARPDWSKFTTAQVTQAFKEGTRVIRGRDWSYSNQGSGTSGTVEKGLGNYSSSGWLQVRWDDGKLYSYRMGGSGKYDLYLEIPSKFPW